MDNNLLLRRRMLLSAGSGSASLPYCASDSPIFLDNNLLQYFKQRIYAFDGEDLDNVIYYVTMPNTTTWWNYSTLIKIKVYEFTVFHSNELEDGNCIKNVYAGEWERWQPWRFDSYQLGSETQLWPKCSRTYTFTDRELAGSSNKNWQLDNNNNARVINIFGTETYSRNENNLFDFYCSPYYPIYVSEDIYAKDSTGAKKLFLKKTKASRLPYTVYQDLQMPLSVYQSAWDSYGRQSQYPYSTSLLRDGVFARYDGWDGRIDNNTNNYTYLFAVPITENIGNYHLDFLSSPGTYIPYNKINIERNNGTFYNTGGEFLYITFVCNCNDRTVEVSTVRDSYSSMALFKYNDSTSNYRPTYASSIFRNVNGTNDSIGFRPYIPEE